MTTKKELSGSNVLSPGNDGGKAPAKGGVRTTGNGSAAGTAAPEVPRPANKEAKTEVPAKKKKAPKKSAFNAQAFLIEHGEKLAFGACAVLILWGFWSALSATTYNEPPARLSEIANEKLQQISQNKPEVREKDFAFVNFEQRVRESQGQGVPKHEIDGGFGGSPVVLARRTQPTILAPIEPSAALYVGAFALIDPSQGATGGGPVGRAPGGTGPGGMGPGGMGPGAAPGGLGPGGAPGGLGPGAAPGGLGPGAAPGGLTPGGAPGGKRSGKRDRDAGLGVGVPPGGEGFEQGQQPNIDRTQFRKGVHPPAGSRSEGITAVVVTYRFPAVEQRKLFEQAFANARRPRGRSTSDDLPRYLTFVVERADVTDDPANPTWSDRISVDGQEKLLVTYNLAQMNKWAAYAPEVIDWKHVRPLQLMMGNPQYYEVAPKVYVQWTGFTSPLGPILNDDWGDFVRGSFDLATPASGSVAGPAQGGVPGLPDQAPGGTPGAGPGGVPGIPGGLPGAPGGVGGGQRRQVRAGPGGLGGVGGAGGAGVPPGAGGIGAGIPPGGYGGAGVPPGAGIPPGGNPMGGAIGGLPADDGGNLGTYGQQPAYDPNADFLIRFFDYSVENGRRYTYRIKVVLWNPNYQIEKRFLEDEKLAKAMFLESAWGEATAPITVSSTSQLLAGGSVSRPGGAITTRMILRQRDPKTGAMVAHEIGNVERGQVLDYEIRSQDVLFRDPVTLAPHNTKPFSFQTRQLVVDALGGEKVGRFAEASQLLVMDESGRLDVKSEDRSLTSSLTFQRVRSELEEIKAELNQAKAPVTNSKQDPLGGGSPMGRGPKGAGIPPGGAGVPPM